MQAYKTFETEHLILRPCTEEDGDFIFQLVNTEKWLKYIGNRNVNSAEEGAAYVKEKMLPQLKRLGFGNYLVQHKSDGAKMGTCGLFDREGMEGVDIGFAFLPEFEKQGYAYESSWRLLQAAFKDFHLKIVKAITTQNNYDCHKLLEKLGLSNKGDFVLEGDPEKLFLFEVDHTQFCYQQMKKALKNEFILAEGAINERIRRSEMENHPTLSNAPLIYENNREALADIYKSYIDIAQKANRQIFMYTPTWRANKERVKRAGINPNINQDACQFMQEIKNEYLGFEDQIKIGGLIGPKNDCYKPNEALSAEDAKQFHNWQIDELVAGGVDFIVPETLPALSEATGIAEHCSTSGIPYMISFVIARDGKILDGTPLDEAIETIDNSVCIPPLGYAINCAHPSFLKPEAINPNQLKRIVAFNANASSLDHCDLENAGCLYVDNVEEWGELMLTLNTKWGIKVLGGCCGTSEEHIQYLADNY